MTIERGFCTNKEHVPAFKAYGLPDKLIYVEGRGAEDFEVCLDSFRGRVGKLLVAPDLLVFGDSKKCINAAMARLEKARIKVVDILHPQHETVAEMLGHAHRMIDGRRFPDRRTARRRGRLGGEAKGRLAALRRAEISTDWLLEQIVNEPGVNFAAVCRALKGKISASTLRRHYWSAP